jgi:hypothetical protein
MTFRQMKQQSERWMDPASKTDGLGGGHKFLAVEAEPRLVVTIFGPPAGQMPGRQFRMLYLRICDMACRLAKFLHNDSKFVRLTILLRRAARARLGPLQAWTTTTMMDKLCADLLRGYID